MNTRRAPRVRFRPKISVLGILAALVGALFAVVFLQQRGSVFPTPTVGITTLVAGLVVGIALPNIGRVIATARLNRRLARLASRRGGPAG